jgi:hypothetical protein
MQVSDMASTDLAALIDKLSAGARNPVLRYWRAVFNLGIKRSYLTKNPVEALDFERRKRKEVETLTNGQVKAMLEHESSSIGCSDVLSYNTMICPPRPVSWFNHENKLNDRGNRGCFTRIHTEPKYWLG